MRLTLTFVVALSVAVGAQAPTLDTLLERMSSYLREYELQLSSVVAEERFDQRVVYTRAYTGGLPKTETERRRLESEIGFLRLPGGVDWLGFRDVRKINGGAVKRGARSVADVLASGADLMSQAKVVADASAEHNLGVPRTTNVPTAALDVIHPSRHRAHRFELRGEETVRRARTAVIGFVEAGRPTLVRDPGGQDLVSRGRVWVDVTSGAIWRIEWIYQAEGATGTPSSLRVEFARDDALDMMVPVEMREVFSSFGGLDARGDGVALYRNFKRFGTSARIVPQLP
jgi:hypothetical protein